MAETTPEFAPPTTSAAPAETTDGIRDPADAPPVPVHRHASFLSRVEGLLKGKRKPANEVAKPLVEDLRTVAAEQEETRKQMQGLSEAIQKAQATLLQSQGKADALLQVLHRLETAADP